MSLLFRFLIKFDLLERTLQISNLNVHIFTSYQSSLKWYLSGVKSSSSHAQIDWSSLGAKFKIYLLRPLCPSLSLGLSQARKFPKSDFKDNLKNQDGHFNKMKLDANPEILK